MEGVTEFDVRHISYKDYLELWKCLLEGHQYKDQKIMIEVSSLRQDVHRAVYDELIMAILKVTNKLDLTSFCDVGDLEVSKFVFKFLTGILIVITRQFKECPVLEAQASMQGTPVKIYSLTDLTEPIKV